LPVVVAQEVVSRLLVEVCALAEIVVDCRGETCPVPLVEARKALRKAAPGDVVEVVGTHPSSKKEIPMAVEALGLEILSIQGEEGEEWKIRIRR
jgi:TusA-related sulfurtransferase